MKFHSRISGNKEETDEGSAPLTSKQDDDCSSGNFHLRSKGVEKKKKERETRRNVGQRQIEKTLFRHPQVFLLFLLQDVCSTSRNRQTLCDEVMKPEISLVLFGTFEKD